ncbi:hypothetical protein [Candidatus Cardinium hertigii]|uniref:hypothetical protein n=1 Tax=Candidatus Cardinium hertigii TaxID=247481 RepID=UPI00194EE654|nr:hypothetical protein [Candidatus Cardinium hertigii]
MRPFRIKALRERNIGLLTFIHALFRQIKEVSFDCLQGFNLAILAALPTIV